MEKLFKVLVIGAFILIFLALYKVSQNPFLNQPTGEDVYQILTNKK